MEMIKNIKFQAERSLYGLKDIEIVECKFDGEEDGESALKECDNVFVKDSYFNLRYPCWHDNNLNLEHVEMTINSRASIWYSNDIVINNSIINSVKTLRECNKIIIKDSNLNSDEIGWKCNHIAIKDSSVNGEYAFSNSSDLSMDNVKFDGKYSFQYVQDAVIRNCKLNTKDAFWHSNNVYVYDSIIKGEYLGWYSNNLHLINCTIDGTQPLCYCNNLYLENCKMINCDLSFEYSNVNGKINGYIMSVKNPIKGYIEADEIGEIIIKDSKYPCLCTINELRRGKVIC